MEIKYKISPRPWKCFYLISKRAFKVLAHFGLKVPIFGDVPGGPVAKTAFPVQGVWVQSLVGELDPTCCS